MSSTQLVLAVYIVYLVTVLSYYEAKKPDYKSGRVAQKNKVQSFGYFYLWLYVSTVILFVLSFSGYDYFASFVTDTYRFLGASISGLGVSLFVLAKTKIGENFSPCQDAYIPKDIVTTGLYRYIRHPIYTAFIVFFAGVFLVTLNPIILMNWLVLAFYYSRSATLEEKELCDHFPGYADYMRSTSRFFPLPKILLERSRDEV